MNTPKVSVLMACYNHETYVGKAIESVLEQTFSDFEFLIIDDCSSDASVEKIKRYEKDKRILFKVSPKNRGVIETFNEMLNASRGEYIAFIGSDDIWMKDKLEKQLDILENNPQTGACFSHMEWIDSHDRLYAQTNLQAPVDFFKIPNCPKEQHLRAFFEKANYLGHPSAVVRRNVAEQIGEFDVRLWQAHDFDWWIKICLKWEIYIVQESLVYYRRDNNVQSISTVTTAGEIRVRHEFENIFLKMMQNIEKQVFIKAFRDVIKKKELSETEFICERFFVLRNWKIWPDYNSRQVAMNFIDEYIQNNSVRECLEQEYSYTLKDYYADNALLRQPYPLEYQEEYRELQKRYEETLKQLQRINQEYQSTLSWKITKPIRLTKKIMKRIIRK